MKSAKALLCFSAFLAGCASLSSNIASGNFSYLSSDVSVSPFGSNYEISTMLESGNQRVIAKTFATACQNGFGDVTVEGRNFLDTKSYPASMTGDKGQDEIFKRLCIKGMPIAYAKEDRLSDSDKQKRSQAVQQYLSKPKSASRIKVNTDVETQPRQPVSVTCTTSKYSEGSYTNCKEQ